MDIREPRRLLVGVIKLFLRPVFVIASCKLYSDYLRVRSEKAEFNRLPGRAAGSLVAFLVLCLIVLALYLLREETGLMRVLRVAG